MPEADADPVAAGTHLRGRLQQRRAGPEPGFCLGDAEDGIDGRALLGRVERIGSARVVDDALQLLGVGQPPVVVSGQRQLLGVGQGLLPVARDTVIDLLPPQAGVQVGDGAVAVVLIGGRGPSGYLPSPTRAASETSG